MIDEIRIFVAGIGPENLERIAQLVLAYLLALIVASLLVMRMSRR